MLIELFIKKAVVYFGNCFFYKFVEKTNKNQHYEML